MKKALIFGVTGQDGSLLAEELCRRGYEVHGTYRRVSTGNASNLFKAIEYPNFTMHRCEITDLGSVYDVVQRIQPDLVFNEADQDNVEWSRAVPQLAVDVTYGGVLNVLQAVRPFSGIRLFQPVSALMLDDAQFPQTEETPHAPRSPYACSKSAAFHLCRHYRDQYGVKVTTGILYNHESERRSEEYLLHKICRTAVLVARGRADSIELWDPDQHLEIGWAEEFVRAIVDLMEVTEINTNGYTVEVLPADYVVSTRNYYQIRNLVASALYEAGSTLSMDQVLVRDPSRGFTEVSYRTRCGNSDRLRQTIGWSPQIDAEQVVARLVAHYERVLT